MRKHETAGLALDNSTEHILLSTIDLVAVSHITTRHTENDVEGGFTLFLKLADGLSCLVADVALFDGFQ